MPYNNRILVIDDNPAILEVFKSVLGRGQEREEGSVGALADLMLEMEGQGNGTPRKLRHFEITTALQGEEGFAKLKEEGEEGRPFGVIFIDMRMPPGWDGTRTAMEIRRCDPYAQIVVVTAFSDESVSEIVEKIGFTNRLLYLKKPFDEEEILQLADSLSMRWNLEEKCRGFIGVLEGVISDLGAVRPRETPPQLKPLLVNLLTRLEDFIGAPDIFMASQVGENMKFRFILGGDGTESGGISFKEIKETIKTRKGTDEVFYIGDYVVTPIMLREHKDIMVGIRPEYNVEGADRLLTVLAHNVKQIFNMDSRMAMLSKKNENLVNRERELLKKISQMEK